MTYEITRNLTMNYKEFIEKSIAKVMFKRRIKSCVRRISLSRWLAYTILMLVFTIGVIHFELSVSRTRLISDTGRSGEYQLRSDTENQLYVLKTGRYIPYVKGGNPQVESSIDTKSTRKNKKIKKRYFNRDKTLIMPLIDSKFNTSQHVSTPSICKFRKHPYFPHCESKVLYLKLFWNKDPCFYKVNKVDGSNCSIYNYLTNIEPYCVGEKEMYVRKDTTVVSMNYDLDELLALFNYDFYQWMRNRISFLWPTWLSAGKSYSLLRKKRKLNRKRVLVFPGSLEANHFLFDLAGKGGPLGELIQWSDLTTALHLLGYDVIFVTKIPDLLKAMKVNKTVCASGVNKAKIDVIYTDINGFAMLEEVIGRSSCTKYRCMVRVLDSFGTFPEFNYASYPHKIPGGRSGWSNFNLIPTQFLTLYPHTHDNTFLGFVIPNRTKSNESIINNGNTETREKALIYAKHASYIKGYEKYLRIISNYFELHATCVLDHPLPSYIKNHGPVSMKRIQELLSQSKVFVGVGFPFEGPGPLEAMANGAVYLQPKFEIPVNKLNDNFFAGKPTLRELTSQNPYMEEFVGEPYCFTIKVTNENLLRRTLQKIKLMKRPPPKIPKEFSNAGLIERVHAFTEYMDYCNPYSPPWPPLDNLQTFISKPGQSCKDLCMSKGLVCERTYFDEINRAPLIERFSRLHCNEVKVTTSLHPPSVDTHTRTCYIQQQQQTFSCMHSERDITRLCPCRNYEEEQTAICKDCL